MSQLTIDQAMEAALRLHRAGRLTEAEDLYRRIVAVQPGRADAWHYLGVLSGQKGETRTAVELIDKAISLLGNVAEYHCNRGLVLESLGRLDDAVAANRRAIQLRERFPEAHNNLGTALLKRHEYDRAAAALKRAIEIKDDYPAAHANLGNVYKEQWRLAEAIAAYRRAIVLQPELAEHHCNLGTALHQDRQFEEAAAELERAVRLRPDSSQLHCLLGAALKDLGRLDEAQTALRRAIELKPDSLLSHFNLSVVLRQKGLLDEAMAACERALSINDNMAEAHFGRAYLRLLSGDWLRAWPDFEWRRKLPVYSQVPFKQPIWDGTQVDGRTILLYYEQGIGDTIMFARYARRIADGGGRVILACQDELKHLLSGLPEFAMTVSMTETMPPFDACCPLPSLPGIFRTEVASIPGPLELHADAGLAAAWKQRIALEEGMKVGLVWAGNPEYPNDHNRSIPLSRLNPLAEISGARFISLQKGPAARQARDGLSTWVRDWTDELHDWADTAALIVNLDLVVAVDTAVAHLAATLGKPVWLLLPFAADWRWLLDRGDTPWYPTMRLFRQPSPGQWEPVILRVAGELRDAIQGRQ